MGRALLAAIVGAVLVFGWGFVAWPLVGIYDFAVKPMPADPAAIAGLKVAIVEPGVYIYPAMPTDGTDADTASWKERHNAGPIGLIFWRPTGADPDDPMLLVKGFAINFVAALILSLLIWVNQIRSFASRLAFVIFSAVFVIAASYAVLWNWFYVPNDWLIAMTIDVMVAWTLAGIAIAGVIKVRPEAR